MASCSWAYLTQVAARHLASNDNVRKLVENVLLCRAVLDLLQVPSPQILLKSIFHSGFKVLNFVAGRVPGRDAKEFNISC